MTYTNGDVYTGDWLRNVKEGEGTMTYANGNVYTGQLSQDTRDGEGAMTYANGSVYTGRWSRDVKEGEGTMTHCNGNVYTGQWWQDRRDGEACGSVLSLDATRPQRPACSALTNGVSLCDATTYFMGMSISDDTLPNQLKIDPFARRSSAPERRHPDFSRPPVPVVCALTTETSLFRTQIRTSAHQSVWFVHCARSKVTAPVRANPAPVSPLTCTSRAIPGAQYLEELPQESNLPGSDDFFPSALEQPSHTSICPSNL
eukprot:gene21466-27501_t